MARLIIDKRFHGPDDCGYGGYVCGLMSMSAGGSLEVTLRRPAPLGVPLEMSEREGTFVLNHGDLVIAEGAAADFVIDVPAAVSYEVATKAAASYAGFEQHPHPRCFGCGPRREDGLRIFPGWIKERALVAAPWVPDVEFANEDGSVMPEFVWAALDCPGAWSINPMGAEENAVILGRFAVKIVAPVTAGERYVVLGWELGEDGRKRGAGSGLFSAAGRLHASARATWFRLA